MKMINQSMNRVKQLQLKSLRLQWQLQDNNNNFFLNVLAWRWSHPWSTWNSNPKKKILMNGSKRILTGSGGFLLCLSKMCSQLMVRRNSIEVCKSGRGGGGGRGLDPLKNPIKDPIFKKNLKVSRLRILIKIQWWVPSRIPPSKYPIKGSF